MSRKPSKATERRRAFATVAFASAYAVKTQTARLREFDMENPSEAARRDADTQFLVIALWRLRMAADQCPILVDDASAVLEALRVFDEALPRIKTLRHVLMHYDSYLLEGEERRNVDPDSGALYGRKDVEAVSSSIDGVSWLGTEYWFDDVDQHATLLYKAITECLGTPRIGD